MLSSLLKFCKNDVAVCVGAHPDDLVIGAGGFLQLLTKLGIDLSWIVYTGSKDRLDEEKSAASEFDAVCHVQGPYPDARLPDHAFDILDHMKAVRETLSHQSRRVALVLCPSPEDRHQDHQVLGLQAHRVFRDHRIFEYEVPSYDGDPTPKNCFVSLTKEMADEKIATLMRCYPSRTCHSWWREDVFLAWMSMRGVQINAAYAEGFVCKKLHLTLEVDDDA